MICTRHDPVAALAGLDPNPLDPCAWPGCVEGVLGDSWRRIEKWQPSLVAPPVAAVYTDYGRVRTTLGSLVVWEWRWKIHRAESGSIVERH